MKNLNHPFIGRMTLIVILFILLRLTAFSQISLVKDLNPGSVGIGGAHVGNIIKLDDEIYFPTQYGLIKTDGTTPGTQVIEEPWIDELIEFRDSLYFISSDKLYKSDGSPANKLVYFDFNESSINHLGPIDMVAANEVFYVIVDQPQGFHIYMSDGSASGLTDLNINIGFGSQRFLVGDDLYFIGEADGDLYNLYKIKDGVVEFLDPLDGYDLVYASDDFVSIEDQVYFFPTIEIENLPGRNFKTEMWKVNEASSPEVIIEFATNKALQRLVNVKGSIFFQLGLQDPGARNELWESDGTASGTIQIDDDLPFGGMYGTTSNLFYFKKPGANNQLWTYNVDSKNRTLLDENVGGSVLNRDEVLYYFVKGSDGPELWKSDGTLSGTHFLAGTDLFGSTSLPAMIGTIGEDLIFQAISTEYGAELFKYSLNDVQCGAHSVISFDQGKTKGGDIIESDRSQPDKALNDPQENNTYNFVALGFGGSVTMEFNPVYDDGTAEPEIILVETSFGKANAPCFSNGRTIYPEEAFVEVSHDGEEWFSLPNSYCRTSFLDIKPAVDNGMPYARFIKITDASDRSRFSDEADGFDVDGIITCKDEVELAKNRLLNARVAQATGLFDPEFINMLPNEVQQFDWRIYPNPIEDGLLNVMVDISYDQEVNIKVLDLMGRMKLQEMRSATGGANELQIDVNSMRQGSYFLIIETENATETSRFSIL